MCPRNKKTPAAPGIGIFPDSDWNGSCSLRDFLPLALKKTTARPCRVAGATEVGIGGHESCFAHARAGVDSAKCTLHPRRLAISDRGGPFGSAERRPEDAFAFVHGEGSTAAVNCAWRGPPGDRCRLPRAEPPWDHLHRIHHISFSGWLQMSPGKI